MPDKKDLIYWKNFYKKNCKPFLQSSFAEYCLQFLNRDDSILEIGCGNGRDCLFFANRGYNVLGVDIQKEEISFLNSRYKNENLCFLALDAANLPPMKPFDKIYSRFSLHSISETAENSLLDWIRKHLKEDGLFCVESRSINDLCLKLGKRLSEKENYTDHYRRYMDKRVFCKKLIERGFEILYLDESDKFAVMGDDRPSCIRILAKIKTGN